MLQVDLDNWVKKYKCDYLLLITLENIFLNHDLYDNKLKLPICSNILHYRRISSCSKLQIFSLTIVVLFTVSIHAQKFMKMTYTCI